MDKLIWQSVKEELAIIQLKEEMRLIRNDLWRITRQQEALWEEKAGLQALYKEKKARLAEIEGEVT